MPFSDDERRRLLHVARVAIRATVFGHPAEPPADVGDALQLKQPAGCFVSLHETGTRRLRGCVGRLEARDPVLRAVHDAAVSVTGDPRFEHCDPVRPDELFRLEIELTILSLLRDVPHPLDFEPLAHGIYLTLGGHGGCFLPQVARDTGWDREQLLERLCTEKLGLPAHAWRHPSAKLQTFDTQIIGPEPFEETSGVTGHGGP